MNIYLQIKERYGTQKDAAFAIGVSTTSFSEWVNGQSKPSASMAKKIEFITGISREQLRPDIYGN